MMTSTEVKLLGQRIVLRSKGQPAAVQETMELVSAKITQAEERAKGQAAHHVALLALCDLAEEFIATKRRYADAAAQLEEKSKELHELLDVAPREANESPVLR